jgi:hypothetical protein
MERSITVLALLTSYLTADLRRRWRTLRDTGDGGYTTEAVITIAVVAAVAITVLGIIAAKVIAKANSINLG